MASERVFDTTELLEMILYKLPTKDLLLAQRVDKQWKAVIDSSTRLQQALFFQPTPGDPLPRVETPFCETPCETVKAQASRECVINTLLKDVRRNMRQRLRLKTSTPDTRFDVQRQRLRPASLIPERRCFLEANASQPAASTQWIARDM